MNKIVFLILSLTVTSYPLNFYIEREPNVFKDKNKWEITPDYLHIYATENLQSMEESKIDRENKIIYRSPLKFSEGEFVKIALCKPSKIQNLDLKKDNYTNFLKENCVEDLNNSLIGINLEEKLPLFEKKFGDSLNYCSFGMLMAEAEKSLRELNTIDEDMINKGVKKNDLLNFTYVRKLGDMKENYKMAEKMKYREKAIMSKQSMCGTNFGIRNISLNKFSDHIRYVQAFEGEFSYLLIGYNFDNSEKTLNTGVDFPKEETNVDNALKEFKKKRVKYFNKKIYQFPDKSRKQEKLVDFNIKVSKNSGYISFGYENLESFACETNQRNGNFAIENISLSSIENFFLIPLICFKSFDEQNITHDDFRKSRCQTISKNSNNILISSLNDNEKIPVQAVLLDWLIIGRNNKRDLKIDYCGINSNCNYVIDKATKSIFYICYLNYSIKQGDITSENKSFITLNLNLNKNINDSLFTKGGRILDNLSTIQFGNKSYELPGVIVKMRRFGRFCDEYPVVGFLVHLLLIALYVCFIAILCPMVWAGTILYIVFFCITTPFRIAYEVAKEKRRILAGDDDRKIKNMTKLIQYQNNIDKKSLLTFKFFEKNKISGYSVVTSNYEISNLINYRLEDGFSNYFDTKNLENLGYKQEEVENNDEVDEEINNEISELKYAFEEAKAASTEEGDISKQEIRTINMPNNKKPKVYFDSESSDMDTDEFYNKGNDKQKVKIASTIDNSMIFHNKNKKNVFLNYVDAILGDDEDYLDTNEFRRRRRMRMLI